MAPGEVVVLGERGGWHGAGLVRALRDRDVPARQMTFPACAFDSQAPHGLRLGRGDTLPRAVVVRSIPGGSFEQVTLRLGLLHALGELGVLVVNDARAIERCVDKATTSWCLGRAGVPTPPGWAVEERARAAAIVTGEALAGHEVVLKPLFGAQGKGLARLRGDADLPDPEAVAGVWYLQRYVGRAESWSDYRVLVVDGRPVAAMRRHGRSWITNVHQGGRAEAVAHDGELGALAVAAAAAVGAFLAGVDLIATEAGLAVLEVNSMPAWTGLQSVSDVDLAAVIAAAVVARLEVEVSP